ncbi:hypothetical protein FEM48_Zijuj11G0099600 [Ziziphus jujuba var. spinosa]|uniref:Uncharacterized protein n=1 Tax=Ziziphus jujuba var. spinosa TaxID=714518 RepID=A0A978UIA3_ZIZJJ|nr:hypothetical protein FEM48_Zijuj11G0099600 [Ziziphus jujuba var. spinosa]
MAFAQTTRLFCSWLGTDGPEALVTEPGDSRLVEIFVCYYWKEIELLSKPGSILVEIRNANQLCFPNFDEPHQPNFDQEMYCKFVKNFPACFELEN